VRLCRLTVSAQTAMIYAVGLVTHWLIIDGS
jgi:hypothetical protein